MVNQKNKRTVVIYTDGACSGNPGPGGWGAVLLYQDRHKELRGGDPETTNQRMELTAVIEALKALKVEGWDVEVYSDSAYLVNAFNQGWLEKWQRNGWKNAKNDPVANQDLWQELLRLSKKNKVKIIKIAGHSGDFWNERCDALARQAIKEISGRD
ncbi:MAG TPA: ribonuclease HI [Syntrophothermus lipocalidus]|uniref:Ribonuclease H n=1 Tax=Syntrophothermus lipocalidus (strain DSM 12680 / TGB-C1) TaxID=643648 RepID=D7CL51_SYNLT|nr:ribonuclease HI [Syntrophothermus lipocalidus]ADI01436.1 Ribonuclease H [Syntrophothermus lipocalidus DSM 12680]HHV76063.1 ribonuclease HI [Syntrophothermus lipocalidus]